MINKNVITQVKQYRRSRNGVRNRDFVNSSKRINSNRVNKNWNLSRLFKDKAKKLDNNRYLNDFAPKESRRQKLSYMGDAIMLERKGKLL